MQLAITILIYNHLQKTKKKKNKKKKITILGEGKVFGTHHDEAAGERLVNHGRRISGTGGKRRKSKER